MRHTTAMATLLTLLAGCAPTGDDLDAWTQQQRAAMKPTVPSLTEAPAFQPRAYGARDMVDPFDPRRIAPPEPAAPAAGRPPGAALARELRRPRGPLELQALEQMTMVGTLSGGGVVQALVRVDGRVHTVRAGDHLGLHRGRVVRIEESRIELRELVQDASGAWVERAASLQIQGASR